MEKCKTHEEAIVYVKELGYILDNESPREHASSIIARKALRWKRVFPTNGSMVKNHISLKTEFGYNATRRTSFPSWFPGLSTSSSSGSHPSTSMTPSRQERPCSTSSSSSSSSSTTSSSDNETREKEDRTESDTSPVPVSSSNVDDRTGQPVVDQANQKLPKTNKKRKGMAARIQGEILVDDEIPLQGGSHASSSHEVSLEPTTKRREDLGKHSVYIHFPKDRNCEICKRTKITRAPCRRCNGGAVPRAVNFGDLITADHKVLSDNCESRNNHRYASRGAGF